MNEMHAALAKLGNARASYESGPHEEGRYVHFVECQNRVLRLDNDMLREQVRRLEAIAFPRRSGRAA